MNAQTMIVVEKNSARSISCEASAIRSISGRLRSASVRGDVPVDVLDDDHRAVDDDPEVDRADREQVGRLALHVEHRHREQQRQRDHDRHDPRAGEVAEEDEQDGDHQHHAHDQVVHHVVRRDVDEVGPLVEDPESSSPWAAGARVRSPPSSPRPPRPSAATSRTSASGRCPRRRRPRPVSAPTIDLLEGRPTFPSLACARSRPWRPGGRRSGCRWSW